MKLSYVVLGMMEIGAGFLLLRYRESIVNRFQRSWRPFPVSAAEDWRAVSIVGPFAICLGIFTVILGLV